MMAWQYLAVCLCDFIVFPALSAWFYEPNYHEWHPLTLQGGGLYHVAMGAIIGVTAWQRTEEKKAMYQAISPFGGNVTTERTTERTSSISTPSAAPPTKVDIKTDTVQVNTSNPSDDRSTRAD